MNLQRLSAVLIFSTLLATLATALSDTGPCYTDGSDAKCQQFMVLPPLAPGFIEAVTPRDQRNERRLQIGFSRALGNSVDVSADNAGWVVQPNGWRTYAVSVAAPGAVGLRLHLESVRLSGRSRILLYDPSKPASAARVLTSGDLKGKNELWSDTIWGDRGTVELQLAPDAQSQKSGLIMKDVAHLYASPSSGMIKNEDGCYADVTCYPGYANVASGVARIAFIENGNAYVCSGALLAASSSGNYFLTANHCIHSQSLASTIEFYWLYQTSDCNGSVPALTDVPKTTGGADLLAHSDVSDFAFIRLRRSPPSGAARVQWTTDVPAVGEPVAVIHHPGGAYKRISFGNVIGIDPAYIGVQWTLGATEDGSSGGPLFNSNLQLVGQLDSGYHGPGSSCADPSQPDQLGRFDVTYQSIKQWLSRSGGSQQTAAFSAWKGTYTGLVYDESAGISPQSAGSITITLAGSGRFSGSIQLGRSRYSFSGTLAEDASASVTVKSGRSSPLQLALQFGSPEQANVSGTLSGDSFSASLEADRRVFDGRGSVPSQTGQYTVVIPGAGAGNGPDGDSYGTVSVARNGQIRFSGSMADGTKVSQSSQLSGQGQWPLFVPAYGGRGILIGWGSFDADTGVSGDVSWIKPSGTGRVYAGGFSQTTSMTGAKYSRPAGGNNAFGFDSGQVTLQGGSLNDAIVNQIGIDSRGRVRNLSANRLTLSLGSNGLFRGTVVDPSTSKRLTFGGAVLQSMNVGRGYFLTTDQSGEVIIAPSQ